ncbi:hypothetical protein A2767_01365 [Candidatus Roizmanbacteria bacterium RIFCSPHIGHO2_01_FULL_35_10]|uniref:Uncharacterized protein n=1 Tax=Candidatus Roizmanbacteria bacterium RIFCSPLOWO2_01_FULL_35_13 TaxID=1802055 RepID=A0A1F7IH61_9BACT|nr:MAG: hypothetical protein A2767_01365 [Candidatus Roizmanbacteria bacterium RIFCSPHIGHO2_01_FULL_35_10]OGK42688.1 MAG: hypothetical protein A3A74_00070 [Candidatus Roizmanbacteria bacterium RIFCSPLOWO2_01_FULL_35_13]
MTSNNLASQAAAAGLIGYFLILGIGALGYIHIANEGVTTIIERRTDTSSIITSQKCYPLSFRYRECEPAEVFIYPLPETGGK